MLAAKPIARLTPLLLLLALLLLPQNAHAQDQDPDLFRHELEIIRLVNRERRNAGLPPLAWNAEVTAAARGLARDTLENRSAPYCGHTDSRGRSPAQRIDDAGYSHLDGSAENALCGFLLPEAVVTEWMDSAPHRANILNADLRELGVGYYRNAAGASIVVLDLALDRGFAPLVVDDETATTGDQQVRLYLYDQEAGDDWLSVGANVAMMIANTPDFAGAAWEPYTAERDRTLLPGEGWRAVYVKTRDRLGRTTIVRDSIYLGGAIPDAQLSLAYATQVETGFVVDPLDAGGYSHIQFSLNWLADDSNDSFALVSGAGARINDAAAVGGNTFRLAGGGAPATARNWAAGPLGKQAAVAYFRVKLAASNAGAAATLTVNDGSRDVAVRALAANEFAIAGQYQEFAVPFTPSSTSAGLVVLEVTHNGLADLDWDSVALFTAPQPVASPYAFTAPGSYYRSSGVQARLVTPAGDGAIGANFSAPVEVYSHLNALSGSPLPADRAVQVNPAALVFTTSNALAVLKATVALNCLGCEGAPTWLVESDAAWLTATVANGYLQVQANSTGLAGGIYTTIRLSVADRTDIDAITLPVTLLIGESEILLPNRLFIPAGVAALTRVRETAWKPFFLTLFISPLAMYTR